MPSPDLLVVATNRQARRNFELGDTYECGIVLRGSEVKSLRESKVQLTESYAAVENGEMWLHGLHIAPYSHAQSHTGHDTVRPRKLLLHRQEIERIRHRLQVERLALVPLRLYFKDGRAKVEIAVGKGRRTVDKRQDIARRDAEREAARAVARGRRDER